MKSRPASQVIVAVDENRLAACAEPVCLRHREQWQRKKLSNAPAISNLTAPQRQAPTIFVAIASTHEPV